MTSRSGRIHTANHPLPFSATFKRSDILIVAVYENSFVKNNRISDYFDIFFRTSPELSEYVRPYQVASTGLYYNGLNFCQAHYLSPIAESHFLITASDGETTSTSPIYQNSGWPIKANESADR